MAWLPFGNRLATYRRGSGSDVAPKAVRAALLSKRPFSILVGTRRHTNTERLLSARLFLRRNHSAMFHSHRETWAKDSPRRREFARFNILCRARIRIGNRQYAGYLHNISRGGAKLRTISPIRKVGSVILQLPDLRPLLCELRWTDSYNAGVAFGPLLSRSELANWAEMRSTIIEIDEPPESDRGGPLAPRA